MNFAQKVATPYALLSTSDKRGISTLASFLESKGLKILSTGGTAKILRNAKRISDLTSYPEILGGRVKTLHPTIYGGILHLRGVQQHQEELQKHHIPEIDIVVVNLYPFWRAVNEDLDMLKAQELIDIGGVSLIRAAAKNWQNVLVLTDPNDYQELMDDYDNLIKDH